MDTTNPTNDLATQLAGTLQSRDGLRLAQLKQAASLSAAQKSAMEKEQQRLARKYGASSTQAAAAADRLTALNLESDALADMIARASTPVPVVEPGQFVIYGRLFDPTGAGVSGAKLTANDTNGSPIATGTSKAQGVFEVNVPLQSKGKSSRKAADEATVDSPVTVQIVITGKTLPQPYTLPQTITSVAGRSGYLEITLPDSTK